MTSSIFDLKSASMSLVALFLQTTDKAALASELSRRFDSTPDFFNNDPVVIDLSAVASDPNPLNFPELVVLLRRYKLHVVGVRGGSPAQTAAAMAIGLGDLFDEGGRLSDDSPDDGTEVIRIEPRMSATTMVINKPLRSGQQVYARGGDLIVLASVNYGAEVIADGHIHVYAPLRGKAIAGAKGNTDARIFTTYLDPELVVIAGTYRTTEYPLSAEVTGKPTQVRLDGERLVFEPLVLAAPSQLTT
jgi:septum site-determining protein MinC